MCECVSVCVCVCVVQEKENKVISDPGANLQTWHP